jgi:hypothetical protein
MSDVALPRDPGRIGSSLGSGVWGSLRLRVTHITNVHKIYNILIAS